MITTIFSTSNNIDRSIFAINLAAIFTRNLRKVVLVDLTSSKHALNWKMQRARADIKSKFTVHNPMGLPMELQNENSHLRAHYNEILIDTDGTDSWCAESAMAASQIIVIPFWHGQDHAIPQEKLIERIKRIRLFQPTLRVLIVDMQRPSIQSDIGAPKSDGAKIFSQVLPGALLADVVMHEWFGARRAFDDGLSIFECSSRNDLAESEMKQLYQEISRLKKAQAPLSDHADRAHTLQGILHPKAHA